MLTKHGDVLNKSRQWNYSVAYTHTRWSDSLNILTKPYILTTAPVSYRGCDYSPPLQFISLITFVMWISLLARPWVFYVAYDMGQPGRAFMDLHIIWVYNILTKNSIAFQHYETGNSLKVSQILTGQILCFCKFTNRIKCTCAINIWTLFKNIIFYKCKNHYFNC